MGFPRYKYLYWVLGIYRKPVNFTPIIWALCIVRGIPSDLQVSPLSQAPSSVSSLIHCLVLKLTHVYSWSHHPHWSLPPFLPILRVSAQVLSLFTKWFKKLYPMAIVIDILQDLYKSFILTLNHKYSVLFFCLSKLTIISLRSVKLAYFLFTFRHPFI